MASFDREEVEDGARDGRLEMTKYPIKRLEVSIKKFVKVLEIDLSRLHKHKLNISRLTSVEDWHGLHKEQVNASQTIQQIKANIKEIEKVRNQVKDEDLDQFDIRVQDVKTKATLAMEEFMDFMGVAIISDSQDSGQSTEPPVLSGRGDFQISDRPTSSAVHDIPFSSKTMTIPQTTRQDPDQDNHPLSPTTPYGSLPATLTMLAPASTTPLHVVPHDSEAAVSWEQLQEDIVELNDMVHQFSSEIEQQGEVVTSIDNDIETAQINVREGTGHLAKAAKYKSVLLPVVGAVVGGVVAGPIGLVAGAKLGGLAGVVGAGAGFAGGKLVKKHQQNISDVEMKNLTDKRSASLPEIPETDRKTAVKASEDNRNGETQQAGTNEDKDDTDVFSSVTNSFKRFFSFSDDTQTE